MTVRARDGHLEVHARPGAARPRKSPKKAKAVAAAFDRLRGDPNDGGATRHGIVTGYRQDALRCARYLSHHGPAKGATVANETKVPKATTLMYRDVYGWFERRGRGVRVEAPAA